MKQIEVTLARRATTEAVGTALLLATVVGSGIMAERLAGGNAALALLANSLATGAVLIALILSFGPISGAHFNPAVTMMERLRGATTARDAPAYVGAQVVGAFAGVLAAHAMFDERLLQLSQHERAGASQAFSECMATFGLVAVIRGCSARNPASVPYAVGAYISGAYWFTASTSFANPAVTLARSFTDTFAGIRLADAPAFVAAQAVGALAAFALFGWLERSAGAPSADEAP